nr:LysR family transcriptional regulator [Simiduia aestuariiviva]
MENFVRIAEAGGIGRAAEQLGQAKSAVSRKLTMLENRLGTRLIARTTRRWHLTEAGQRCYQQALRLLDANAELAAQVNPDNHRLQGRLRIAAPLTFGVAHLPPAIQAFGERYPGLTIELELADQFVNLIEAGVDLSLRIGDLADSNLRARKLAPISLCLVAAPDYLKRAGTPLQPNDLRHHRLLHYTTSGHSSITLHGPEGHPHSIEWRSSLKANNGEFLNAMAVQGYGIAVSPRFICWQDLAAGRLVPVLGDYSLAGRSLYAVYPASRFVPQRVRLFIDFLVAFFGEQSYWEKP